MAQELEIKEHISNLLKIQSEMRSSLEGSDDTALHFSYESVTHELHEYKERYPFWFHEIINQQPKHEQQVMSNYLDGEHPPVCLHALGQPLINALFAEGKKLQQELNSIRELRLSIKTKGPESSVAEPFYEKYCLSRFKSLDVSVEDNSFVLQLNNEPTIYGDLYGNDSIKIELTTKERSGTPEQTVLPESGRPDVSEPAKADSGAGE